MLTPLLLLVETFVEALLLSTWGTTPGKALLQVRLRQKDGAKLGYGAAWQRSLWVLVRGMGVGIPIIAIFTMLNARRTLVEQGETSWDRTGDFQVTHGDIRGWRIGLAVLVLVTTFGVLLASRG